MTFFENIARRLGTYLLAGAMTVGGCSMYSTMEREARYGYPYREIGMRSGAFFGAMDTDLSREKRKVSIHTDDEGSSGGEVVMSRYLSTFSLVMGLEWSEGTDDLRFKTGVDGKFGLIYRNTEKPDLPEPEPYESYGCAEGNFFTLSPFVGLDTEIHGIGLGLELGLPFTKGKYEVRHYRYDRDDEPIAKYSWEDFGKSINIRLGQYPRDGIIDGYGIVYSFEQYDTRLGGERANIDMHGISFILPF